MPETHLDCSSIRETKEMFRGISNLNRNDLLADKGKLSTKLQIPRRAIKILEN